MESDFSGYATKAGLKCSDGRTIMPEAFAHQDSAQVPLVWQHGHSDAENVLGHAILEKRDDGVYAYGFFNGSDKAVHARELLEHKDITQLSIWANDLIERGGRVLHGAIREVSLVLSGANPGALIENVTIRHSGDDVTELDDEAIIYTGLEIEDGHVSEGASDEDVTHADDDSDDASEDDDETVADVYASMTDKQKEVLHYMIGQALEAVGDVREDSDDDSESDSDELKQDNLDTDDDTDKEGDEMSNVFEQGDGKSPETYELTHSDIEGIVADASKQGSLRDAVENFALSHGINNIDVLFPEAQSAQAVPEFDKRRTEWVQSVLGGASKSPFARVKTTSADLTFEEARAKGYVTGALKREEFFGVQSRTTTPTTIYKKQKLDRDDMIDITDFDVVQWLKGEMRLMLDEELARAILLGDGRDVAHEDKINEGNIRPIATDHDLYAKTVGIDLTSTADADEGQAIIDEVIRNRRYYKGSGMPTFYTSESVIARFLLMKDTMGRKIYSNLSEVASELRVKEIVPVEVMDEMDSDTDEEVLGIIVNLADYVIGADAGGQVSMFDDFDIDYNQYKYLIETRVSGALTKLRSALVLRSVASGDLVTAAAPTFVSSTGVVTIPVNADVDYFNATDDPGLTTPLSDGAQSAIAAGETVRITAVAVAGKVLDDGETSWDFTRDS